MADKEKITIERVKELALKNYNMGGDTIVECYEDYQIRDLINIAGIDTEEKLLQFFKSQYEYDEEQRKAALWGAYGTTDEEEIEKILSSGSEVEEEYEPYEYDDYYTPSCTYGDYSPSNPWDAPGMSIRDFI